MCLRGAALLGPLLVTKSTAMVNLPGAGLSVPWKTETRREVTRNRPTKGGEGTKPNKQQRTQTQTATWGRRGGGERAEGDTRWQKGT